MVKNRLKEVLSEKGDTINGLSKRYEFSQRTLNRQVVDYISQDKEIEPK